MKKINVLLLGVLVLVTGFLGSCKKDSTDSATFDFIGSDPYISADKTVAAGSTIQFKWTVSSPVNMVTFDISKNDALVSGWSNKAIPSASKSTYTDEASLTADSNPGVYTYTFTAYDKDGTEIISKSIKITVTAAAGQVNSYATINMGGSSSTYGSYLDAETGTSYKLSDVNGSATIKSSIDIIFDAGKFYNSGGVFSSSTGTKFATTTITATAFDAITNDASFSALTATSDNVSIAAGNVVFFVTAGGKKGLIKVKTMASASGDLVISEVVQK